MELRRRKKEDERANTEEKLRKIQVKHYILLIWMVWSHLGFKKG